MAKCRCGLSRQISRQIRIRRRAWIGLDICALIDRLSQQRALPLRIHRKHEHRIRQPRAGKTSQSRNALLNVVAWTCSALTCPPWLLAGFARLLLNHRLVSGGAIYPPGALKRKRKLALRAAALKFRRRHDVRMREFRDPIVPARHRREPATSEIAASDLALHVRRHLSSRTPSSRNRRPRSHSHSSADLAWNFASSNPGPGNKFRLIA